MTTPLTPLTAPSEALHNRWHVNLNSAHSENCEAEIHLRVIEAAAAERATAALVERYRFGWCCDFDFDNGTYRSTPECISRTRNADAVERPLQQRIAVLEEALAAVRRDFAAVVQPRHRGYGLPCLDDLHCYRTDGHEGEHAYPDVARAILAAAEGAGT